jgi:hypothetical protein
MKKLLSKLSAYPIINVVIQIFLMLWFLFLIYRATQSETMNPVTRVFAIAVLIAATWAVLINLIKNNPIR